MLSKKLKLSVALLFCITASASALILPPADRMRMGVFEQESMMEECEDESDGFNFFYEEDVEKEYQLMTTVFNRIAACGREDMKLWFPCCLNRQGEVDRLSEVLQQNSERLGGLKVRCQHWPEVPASMLEATWEKSSRLPTYQKQPIETVEQAVKDTADYVEERLSKLSLCPYTKSMNRAAIGLESLGVKEGPVAIRHAASIEAREATPAAVMAALYWQGITELIERPEDEVATHLLVAPGCYDTDFEQFYKTCDDLLESTIKLLLSASVGRVWFHPHYKLSEVGYSTGGHTLPLPVVSGYLDEYLSDHLGASKPSYEDMAWAHDQTRWTPHATINLLRGPQLKKAQANENRVKVYARNILKILENRKTCPQGGQSQTSILQGCPFPENSEQAEPVVAA